MRKASLPSPVLFPEPNSKSKEPGVVPTPTPASKAGDWQITHLGNWSQEKMRSCQRARGWGSSGKKPGPHLAVLPLLNKADTDKKGAFTQACELNRTRI